MLVGVLGAKSRDVKYGALGVELILALGHEVTGHLTLPK